MKPLINFKKLIITIWVLLWAILFMLVIGKVLFHQWYPIVIENDKIWLFSNYVDEHYPLKFCLALLFYIPNVLFVYLICTRKRKPSLLELIVMIPLAIANDIVKSFNNTIGMIIEIIILVVIPILANFKYKTFSKKYWNILFPLISNAILSVWQLNFLFIRDINELLKDMPFMISIILQLDYYIFLIIFWLGVCNMSIFGVWFFGKSLTELEAMKAKEEAKENPDEVYINQIEERIKKLKEVE